MKGTTEPPITSGQMKWLTDEELEEELTMAALNARRPERFARLESERQRRRDLRPKGRWHLLRRRDGTPADTRSTVSN